MSMIGFPLLLIPLAIVNIVVFLMGLSLDRLQEPVTTAPLTLPSLQPWTVTFSDVLLAMGLLLLFFEVVKSARPGAKYFTDHLLSFIVFAVAAAEFLLLPKFAHSTFFLLMLMAFTDVIAGVAIRAVRPKPVMARAEPAPAGLERPLGRPVVAEPALRPSPVDTVEPPVMKSKPDEIQVAAEQHDVRIASHQDILPPEPTAPRG